LHQCFFLEKHISMRKIVIGLSVGFVMPLETFRLFFFNFVSSEVLLWPMARTPSEEAHAKRYPLIQIRGEFSGHFHPSTVCWNQHVKCSSTQS